MASCEEAIEFALPKFSRCLACNPAIKGHSLFVDGHLLDEIDTIYSINDKKEVLELVVRLEEWLKERDKTMFNAYGDPQNLTGQTDAKECNVR